GRFNFLQHGLLYADALTTVSPTYAREIQTSEYGVGLDELLRRRADSLTGILNGVGDEWDPRSDALIPQRYSVKSLYRKEKNKQGLRETVGLPSSKEAPVLGIVSRLTAQKGFELVAGALPVRLAAHDLRVAALGTGEPRYEAFFAGLQQRFPRQVGFHRG